MKTKAQIILFSLFYLVQVKVHADWGVDLSRRQVEFQKVENTRMPVSVVSVNPTVNTEEKTGTTTEVVEAIKRAVSPVEISKDIVIVQTETGFVPDSINLQKGVTYQIHVVNLNTKEKNVSFLMDSFSQTHNTVFGNMRSFKITPSIEGVFSYQSPETGASGTVVIVGDKVRKVASDEKGK